MKRKEERMNRKWEKSRVTEEETQEMVQTENPRMTPPTHISLPPSILKASSQPQTPSNTNTSSTGTPTSPTSTTAPLRPKEKRSTRQRRIPDTSNDLSRNWLTTTAAPVFSRTGLKAQGVVMPVKEEVEVEEESVGKKETALRRLGRLLGMWKRENGGERDVAIVPGGIRQANV